MELLRPAETPFALPKIFSPQVIIRDGRGCFGSRTIASDDPKPVSGVSQDLRSQSCHVDSRSCHTHSRSCHAKSQSCHVDSRPCHVDSRSCPAHSRSCHANSQSCHANSQSCHANSRTCHANSRSCHANSCQMPSVLDLSQSSDCRFCENGGKNDKCGVSSNQDDGQCPRERRQTNFAGHHYLTDCNGYKHVGDPSALEGARKAGLLQCSQDIGNEELSLAKDRGHHERTAVSSWYDHRRVGCHQQSPWRESGRQFGVVTGSGRSPESGGDRVTCAGTWVPPQGPPPPPPPPLPPPPPHPTPPLSSPPHRTPSRLDGPPPLLFCPPTRNSLEALPPCLEGVCYELNASMVSPSEHHRGRSAAATDSARALAEHETADSVTNSSCNSCERCSSNRMVPSSSGRFSGSSGYLRHNYDSVQTGTFSETLSGENHTSVASKHANCSCSSVTYVPEYYRPTQNRGKQACWNISGGADHDLTKSGHTSGRTSVKMIPSDCQKRGTDHRYEVPSAVTLRTDSSTRVSSVDLHHEDNRQQDHHDGREFPSGGPRTPSHHDPQSPDVSWNDRHSLEYASRVVEYHGIWTVIKAGNVAPYSAVHVFATGDQLPADFQSTVPDHTQRHGFDVRHGRVGEPSVAHEQRPDRRRPECRDGFEAGLLRFGEELFGGKRYSPNSFLSTNCLSNFCSCMQHNCEEPYDLSTKTVENTTRTKLAATTANENSSSYSAATNGQMSSNTFETGVMFCNACDIGINPCYKRHVCDERGCRICSEAQKDKTRNMSSTSSETSKYGERAVHHVSWMPPFPAPSSFLSASPDVQRPLREISQRPACSDIGNPVQCPPYTQLPQSSQKRSYDTYHDTYQKDQYTHYSTLTDAWSSRAFPQTANTSETNECVNTSKTTSFRSSVVPQTQNISTATVPRGQPTTLCSERAASETARVTSQLSQKPATAANLGGVDTRTTAVHHHQQSELQTTTERETVTAATTTTTTTTTTTPTPTPPTPIGATLCAASSASETAGRGSELPKPVILSSTMAVVQKGSGGQCAVETTAHKRQQHERPVRKRRPRLRTFQCALCSVACSNRGQLQGHLRTHTGGHL